MLSKNVGMNPRELKETTWDGKGHSLPRLAPIVCTRVLRVAFLGWLGKRKGYLQHFGRSRMLTHIPGLRLEREPQQVFFRVPSLSQATPSASGFG